MFLPVNDEIDTLIFNLIAMTIVRKSIFGALSVILLFALLSTFTTVEAGERGVVLRWGAFHGEVLEPGLHWLIPIADRVVKMNVQTQKFEIEDSEAYSHDLQVVKIHSAVNYVVDAKAVGLIYQNIGTTYESKILDPAVQASVKQVVAKYSAEDILGRRSEVQDEIEATIKSIVAPSNIIVTRYSLVNESFSEAYEAAIEQKQVAQQDAERANNELKKAQIDAEQRIAQAKGEAEAIKIQSEAIQQQGGAAYVNLKTIEKWNGMLPQYMMGNTVPFINLNK